MPVQIEFEAMGKTRALRFTTNRIVQLEEKAGRGIGAIAGGMGDGKIGDVRLMIACGMGVKPDDAGDIIDDIGLQRAVELLGQALQAAFPDADQSDTGNGAAAG